MSHRTVLGKTAIALAAVVAFVAPASAGDGWQWSITPYMWATDISETLILDGTVVGGDDTEFSDLVDKIDASLQLHLEGTGDRWGLFGDLTYVDVKDSQTGQQGYLRLEAEVEEMVTEAGAVFRPGGRDGRLDLLLGVRYMTVDEHYLLVLADLGSVESRVDEGYLDAMVGARLHIPLSERWLISLRGDVSAGGTDYMWTAHGLLGWTFGKKRSSAIFIGYRYRDMKYTKADVIEVKKTLSGPGLGVRIGF